MPLFVQETVNVTSRRSVVTVATDMARLKVTPEVVMAVFSSAESLEYVAALALVSVLVR